MFETKQQFMYERETTYILQSYSVFVLLERADNGHTCLKQTIPKQRKQLHESRHKQTQR